LGEIVAGKSIEAIPDSKILDLAEMLLGSNRIVLKVQGNAMIESGILNGGFVIVEQRNKAEPNDIVVALIDNGEATLKRFMANGDGKVTLIPANAAMRL